MPTQASTAAAATPRLPAQIEIPVRLDSAAFQDFSLFDVFRLRRRWCGPALFAVLMIGFACACFALNTSNNQGILLGVVLAVVGVALPLVYLIRFLQSVKAECKKLGLDKPHGLHVYTVTLTRDTVTRRTTGDPPQTEKSALSALYGAWRTKTAVYLYLDAAHALLLPAGQANCSDNSLWAFLQAYLPAEKCHDKT